MIEPAKCQSTSAVKSAKVEVKQEIEELPRTHNGFIDTVILQQLFDDKREDELTTLSDQQTCRKGPKSSRAPFSIETTTQALPD
jgi:hypothetical protein